MDRGAARPSIHTFPKRAAAVALCLFCLIRYFGGLRAARTSGEFLDFVALSPCSVNAFWRSVLLRLKARRQPDLARAGHLCMLPEFRILVALTLLSVSVPIFGLGAAALLRAAHEGFVNPRMAHGPAPDLRTSGRDTCCDARDVAGRYTFFEARGSSDPASARIKYRCHDHQWATHYRTWAARDGNQ